MKLQKITRPNEDIHVLTSRVTSTGYTLPFNNVPYSKTQTLVPEIIRVTFYNALGGTVYISLARGQTAPISADDAQVIMETGASNAQINQMDFHDGAGNGLLVPENHLYFSSGQGSAGQVWRIYYKYRIVDNEDLYIYYYNYNKT